MKPPPSCRGECTFFCRGSENKFLGKNEKSHMLVEVFTEHNKKMKELLGKGYSKGT